MESKQNNEPKVITSVLKALDVLELVSKHEDGLTVTEISNILGYGTSATYHLLNTLKIRHYLSQDPNSKKYVLGWQLNLLCTTKPVQEILVNVCLEYMQQLTDIFDENCNLLGLEGNNVKYIAQTECKQLIRMFTQKGVSIPFYCTGGGKAIFAYLSDAEQQQLLSTLEFEKFTANTITSVESIFKDVIKIKKDGVAFDREEREMGVECIAAPIFDGELHPIAAISISCPKFRLDAQKEKAIADAVRDAARKISDAISSL